MKEYEYYVLDDGCHCVVGTTNSFDGYYDMVKYFGENGTEIEIPDYFSDYMLNF